MAYVQIPNLPAVASLSGAELFEGVQSGTSVKISLNQIIAATRGGLPTTIPIPVILGGTGVATLTGYVKGSGTSPFTASATIPNTDITGLGTMSVQDANAVAITGGTIDGTPIGGTTRAAVNATALNANDASVISVSSASPALTVTQTGAGHSILVEDTTSPDATPFVVSNDGNVGVRTSTPNFSVQSALTTQTDNRQIGVTENVYTANFRAAYINLFGASASGTTYGVSNANLGLLQFQNINGLIGTNGANPIFFATSGVQRFIFGELGQFGIGAGSSYGTTGQTIISAGALAAPAWGALGTAGGGTGITSYAIGDILFASTSSVLSRLADVATGNALISGGVGVAPSYGKIGLTTHVSGTLGVGNGGTGQASNLTQYGVIYGSTTTAMATTAAGTATQVLHGNASGAPTFGAVSLTADVSGTLPAANGGTGVTTAPAEAARILGFTSTATAAGTTVLTNTSTQYQVFTGVTTQTITLPVTSTLGTGWSFRIVNNSTGSLTVNSSGGNLVATIIAGLSAMVTCIGTTLTTAADWEAGFTDFTSVTGAGAVVLGAGPTITAGVLNGTVGATTPSTGAFTTVTASTSVLSSGTGGVGYSTGAGGTITQLTSRTTGVTLSKTTGQITLFSATTTAGTFSSFTVTNTLIAATDVIIVNFASAATADRYSLAVTAVAAGSFRIQIHNIAAVGVAEAPVINFAVIKGVNA